MFTVSAEQNRTVGWAKDSNSWKPPSWKLSLLFGQPTARTEAPCRTDWNLIQWNGSRGNHPQCLLAWYPSDIRHLDSRRWIAQSNSLVWNSLQETADTGEGCSVCFIHVRETILWESGSKDSANVCVYRAMARPHSYRTFQSWKRKRWFFFF